MTLTQGSTLALLAVALTLFIWGRWRHDVVALMVLLAAVVLGIIPVVDTFSGFGHPAVITVAAVLIISRGLSNSGAVELMARRIVPTRGGPTLLLLSLCLVSAGLSAFMNNIGALALLMPVALQAARRNNLSPAILLMPLSFASLLGGMTTLIGTPPNIIIAGFRSRTADAPFGMFDFTPVGIAVALSGGAFVALVGWRLLPRKRRGAKAPQELLEIAPYVTELRVKEKAKVAGRMIGEIEDELSEAEVQILGLIRGERRILVPGRRRIVQSGDLLVVESQPEPLAKLAASHGLELAGVGKLEPSALQAGDIVLMEAVVRPDSLLAGLTVGSIDLHARYNVNLLGVSRQGRHRHQRLTDFRFEPGDVLLLQGDQTRLGDFVSAFGCAPLAERQLQIVKRFQPIQAVGALLVAVVAVAAGILPAEIALSAAALAIVLMGIVPIRRVYESIDWSIIVLLAALIPVAGAIEASGAADLIARSLIAGLASGSAVIGLVIVMVVTMMLTDVMNNSATAAVMAPIAIGVAARLGVSADPFLMAVAIGASCAFLTPIGHQNNTLILGPGGYRFTDFWRMGLPLEIVVVAVSIPMLLYVWPF